MKVWETCGQMVVGQQDAKLPIASPAGQVGRGSSNPSTICRCRDVSSPINGSQLTEAFDVASSCHGVYLCICICVCVFVFVFVKLWLFGLLVWGISSLMRPVGANRCLIWENSYLERRPLDFCLPASIHREYLQIPNCNVGIKDFSLLGNICTNPSLTIQRLIVHCNRFGRRLDHQIAPPCYLWPKISYKVLWDFPVDC